MIALAMALCVCVAAIERATAYLDTGELPWDMDLFDKNTEVSCSHITVKSVSVSQKYVLYYSL